VADENKSDTIFEWELSCTAENAKKMIKGSLAHLLKPFPFSFGSYKGIDVGDYGYVVWEVSGWKNFGFPLAFCKLRIVPRGDKSRVAGRISLTWPLRFFGFGGKVVAPLVIISIISWLMLVLGSIFPTFESFSSIYVPIFMLTLSFLVLRLTRMFAEEQVNDLSAFLQRIFRTYIIN
jgi:hypothetical protein